MVNFVRLDAVKQFDQVRGIGDIAVVQKKPHAVDVRILIEMVDALGIKG